MLRRFSPLLLTLQFVLNLGLTLVAVKVAELLRIHIITGFERRDQFVTIQPWVYLLVLAIWAFFFLLFGALDSRRGASLIADLGNLWLSITVSMLVLASVFYLLALPVTEAPSRLFYGYFYLVELFLLSVALIASFRILGMIRGRGRNLRRVLLVGAGVHGRHVAVRLRGQEGAGVVLVGHVAGSNEMPIADLALLGQATDLRSIVAEERIDEVVIALPAALHDEVLRMTSDLENLEVNVRVLPDVFDMVAMRTRVEDFYGLPLISIREPSMSSVQGRIKRIFDVVVSGILLIITSPALLVIALWIKLDSPGPTLIHQCRVGTRGKPFRMHKFRSMNWRPDAANAVTSKQPNDPRVTGAGRFLRRTSLDELPQLWNVLSGEMSLVGPRPELPEIVERYEPWQRKRFGVPPGMTGWWQVNGRAEREMHLNTEDDLFYVQNYSVLLDVQILLRTVGAVIRGKGAY